MEDSAFSSDFATSFLTWDEDETAAPFPSAATTQNNNPTGAQIPTRQPVEDQQQAQNGQQQQYARVQQFQLMMGNTAAQAQQQVAMASGQSFATLPPHMVGMMPPNFHSMVTQAPGSAVATVAAVSANVQPNSSTNQGGLGGSAHVAATGFNAPQLHPLGIQSSANCPPHVPNGSYLPLMYNPFLQTAVLGTNQQMWAMVQTNQQQQNYQQTQQQNQLQQNFQQTQQFQQQQQIQQAKHQQQQGQQEYQNQQNQMQQQTQAAQSSATTPSNSESNVSAPSPDTSMQAPAPLPPPSAPAPTKTTQPNGKPMPPFFLFDAPCELRANFLQSQRMHNLPMPEDNNSFHYGMAVNGFHPQINAQLNPGITPMNFPPLVDGRSKKGRKAGKERNEREQKRAQKITDLIEKLRYSMEKAGWKVEMKSKYHTLSTCADYVKHLAKSTKEKEELVEKAKSDLKMSERKLEEEKANLERSDPESVASSLTCGSKRKDKNESDRKRSADRQEKVENKKVKVNDTSSESSSSDGHGRNGPGMKNIALNKMNSGMSDMTDSNKGSSESGDGNNELTGSVSSTAAIARGSINNEAKHADVVVKVRKQQDAPPVPSTKNQETTSIDPDFELDYQEVFVSSNVPQLIATTAGRIVTCNDFFVKAVGLSKEDVSRLTIFSIVQPHKLSNLFEMVADALRGDRHRSERNEEGSGGGSDSSGNTTTESDKSGETSRWAAMTLPCVTFPSRTRPGSAHHPNPLYMTIALMTDDDPRKRCFHCILTDNPGTDGTMGYVTPELLEMLFAPERPVTTQSTRDISSPSSKSNTESNGSFGNSNHQDSYMYNEDEDDDDDDDDDDVLDAREASASKAQ